MYHVPCLYIHPSCARRTERSPKRFRLKAGPLNWHSAQGPPGIFWENLLPTVHIACRTSNMPWRLGLGAVYTRKAGTFWNCMYGGCGCYQVRMWVYVLAGVLISESSAVLLRKWCTVSVEHLRLDFRVRLIVSSDCLKGQYKWLAFNFTFDFRNTACQQLE